MQSISKVSRAIYKKYVHCQLIRIIPGMPGLFCRIYPIKTLRKLGKEETSLISKGCP